MNLKYLASAVAAGLAGLSTVAVAQVPNDTDYCVDYEYLYEEVDFFDDEVVSPAEYSRIGDLMFSYWDTDESGFIEEDEFRICYDSLGWDVGDGITVMDLDDDNFINREEFFNENALDELDADNSDVVTVWEAF